MEPTPQHNSASNGLAERTIRTIGEPPRTLRYDTQNRYKTRITPDSVIWTWAVRNARSCITRYARGAGGSTPFRAACDRDYRQEVVPFAETVLFKILEPEHCGLSSGRSVHVGHTAWDKGILLGESETNPEPHCWDKEWRSGDGNNPKAGTGETFRNSVVARNTRKALRRGTPAPALPPVHEPPDR